MELPKATGKNRELVENCNIMVFGKKGFGKSTWVEEVLLTNKRRLVVIDALLKDYSQGDVFTDFSEFGKAIAPKNAAGEFRYILRAPGHEKEVFRMFRFDPERRRALLSKTTLVVEEITNHTDSYNLDESLMMHLQYGRHAMNNLVGVARSPFEINRHLTRQTDIIVSFRQDEENDLKYFRQFDPEKAERLRKLERGEYLVMRGTEQELLDFIAQS